LVKIFGQDPPAQYFIGIEARPHSLYRPHLQHFLGHFTLNLWSVPTSEFLKKGSSITNDPNRKINSSRFIGEEDLRTRLEGILRHFHSFPQILKANETKFNE
jgi:hypothetical protein